MYASIAPKLLDLGIYSVPIKPGFKHPYGIDEWQHESSTPEGIENLCRLYPNYGIGVRTGPLSGIINLDFDIWDTEKYNILLQATPKSPIGKFGEKGGGFFYRMQNGMTHKLDIMSGEARSDKGQDKIEVLTGDGGSQTVIPPSLHPRTKKPYIWLQNEALWEIKSKEDLPVFTFDNWNELCVLFRELYPNSGRTSESSGGRNDTLKSFLAANLKDGYDLNEIIHNIIQYDISLHGENALFSDNRENRTSSVEINASRFVFSNINSINAIRTKNKKKPYSLRVKTHSGLSENPSAEFYIDGVNSKGKPVKTPQWEVCVEYFKNKYDCHYSKGMFYLFDGKKFARKTETEVGGEINKVSNYPVLPAHFDGFIKKVKYATTIDQDFASLERPLHINLQNGIYSLETGELKPHSPEYRMGYVLPYDFNKDAKCPMWESFLSKTFETTPGVENLERIELLQEMFGYILEGGFPYLEKSFWLLGDPRTGKGTTTYVLEHLLGEDAVSAIPLHELDKGFSMVHVVGKKVNIIEEIPEYVARNLPADAFKNAISGGRANVSFKGKDVFTPRINARFVISANNKPNFGDTSGAVLRRIIWIPFENRVSDDQQDSMLKQRLTNEMSGIFNWAVEGYRRLKRNDNTLTQTADQKIVSEEYKREESPVYQWLSEFIIVNRDSVGMYEISTALMYDEFRKWLAYIESSALISRVDFGRKARSYLKNLGAVESSASFRGGPRYSNIRINPLETR